MKFTSAWILFITGVMGSNEENHSNSRSNSHSDSNSTHNNGSILSIDIYYNLSGSSFLLPASGEFGRLVVRLRLSTTDIFLTVPGLVGRLDGLCAGLSSLVVGLVGLLEGRLSPPAADDFRRCSLPEEGAMLGLSEDTLGLTEDTLCLVGAASVETAGLPPPKMDSRLSMDCLCAGAAA